MIHSPFLLTASNDLQAPRMTFLQYNTIQYKKNRERAFFDSISSLFILNLALLSGNMSWLEVDDVTYLLNVSFPKWEIPNKWVDSTPLI
jgi:hypothetical protein